MKVSFVIPSYNNFRLVNQLLVDINEHSRPDEIIVVDDSSNDTTAIEGLNWWCENYNVKVIRTPENLGFLKASNYGLKRATGDVLCLISTDVRIHGDFIHHLKDTLKEVPKSLFGGIVYRDSTGWNEFNGKIFPYVEGWLLATGKEQWEELRYFDEIYSPCDYEDVDLSTKALSKGYSLYSLPNGMVSHVGAQTIHYGEDREKQTLINKEKFRIKWITENSDRK